MLAPVTSTFELVSIIKTTVFIWFYYVILFHNTIIPVPKYNSTTHTTYY